MSFGAKVKNSNICAIICAYLQFLVNYSVRTVFNFGLLSLTEGQLPTFSIASQQQLIKINLKRHSVMLTLKQAQIIITNDTQATGELESSVSQA